MARVREARFEDHGAVARLEERYGLVSTPEADWRNRWAGNPAIREAGRPWPPGWVLETETGGIGGFFGNIPMAYELDGRRLLAAATNSWVVDDGHRSQALELLSRFLSQDSVDLFLSTTANRETSAALAAFKAKKVPQPDCDEALYWVTDYAAFGRAAAAKGGWPLAGLAGAAAGAGLAIGDALRGGTAAARPPRGFRLAVARAFDERFETLWQRIRRGPGKLRLVRDLDGLDWHFRRFLDRDQGWIVTSENDAGLAGYAVFVRQDNPAIGLERAMLADIQAADDDADVLRGLLAGGIGECRARGLHMLEVVGFGPAKRQALKRLGPRTRRLPTWPYFYKARDAALARRLEDPGLWDAGPADGDASL